jgi:hypothetical protein
MMNQATLAGMLDHELRRALARLREAGEERYADDIVAIERELAWQSHTKRLGEIKSAREIEREKKRSAREEKKRNARERHEIETKRAAQKKQERVAALGLERAMSVHLLGSADRMDIATRVPVDRLAARELYHDKKGHRRRTRVNRRSAETGK